MKRIAIIGAGISGLAAATTIERARRSGAAVDFVLFERADRLGGVMITDHIDGCLIEAGPDSFLSEKTYGLDFCRSLGLGDKLIGSNDSERKTYILVNGRLIAMPDGLMFMVPTKILPTVTTPLFSIGAKIRMAFEYLHKPHTNPDGHDETVAELVERHFGREMVERLADPLLAGVYGGDAASLSAAAVLPRFVDMEKNYGSLSRAMLAARKKMAAAAKNMPPGTKPRPLFSSLYDGMQQLVDAVQAFLPADRGRTGVEVTGVHRALDHWLVNVNGTQEPFDAVILALPAYASAALAHDTSPDLAGELTQISYSSSVTVTGTYERAALAKLPPGFGFLVPRGEKRRMLACTFVHNKFPHRAPPDRGIIRSFLGGLRDESVLELSDEEILATVHRELREILGLTTPPRFERVYRWRRSMAQYGPGHLARVARIQQLTKTLPSFALAGNAYQGIGVPDCIASGQTAAANLLAKFGVETKQDKPQTIATR